MFEKAIWPGSLSSNNQSMQDHEEQACRLQDLV